MQSTINRPNEPTCWWTAVWSLPSFPPGSSDFSSLGTAFTKGREEAVKPECSAEEGRGDGEGGQRKTKQTKPFLRIRLLKRKSLPQTKASDAQLMTSKVTQRVFLNSCTRLCVQILGQGAGKGASGRRRRRHREVVMTVPGLQTRWRALQSLWEQHPMAAKHSCNTAPSLHSLR